MTIPTTLDEALAARGEYRAGGTDLQQRLRSGVARGPVVDLRGLPDLARIDWDADGSVRLGALLPVDRLARDERLRTAWPALAQAAAALATPQIRAVGTLGGNLLQRNRCWYFRNPHVSCLRKGGDTCPARTGNHLFHACFDLGPCIAPHPSTLGMALLACDAQAEIAGPGGAAPRAVAALYGDGSDGRRDHQLEAGEVLTAVRLPPPRPGERGSYFRAITRARAEWPLAEAAVRLHLQDRTVSLVQVAVGGVAPVPLRLPQVEAALLGRTADAAALEAAAARAADGAAALPMTGHKPAILCGTVLEALRRAAA